MSKVIIVGQSGTFNLEGFVARAFSQLGWTVERFNVNQNISDYERLNKYARMLSSRSYKFHVLLDNMTRMEAKILSMIAREQPDLLLVIKGEDFPPNSARTANAEFGIKTALWFPDDPRFLDSLLTRIAPAFDHVIVSARSTIPLLRDIGVGSVFHLPFACDPLIHRTIRTEKNYDVTFVGSYYPERAKLLSKLPGLNVRIWGPNWNLPWVPRGIRKQVMHTESYGEKFIEIMNRSKITINIHASTDLHATGKINMRVFEVAGCGNFQLTDRPPGLEEFFVPGREVVYYESPEELVELAKYYLQSEEERERIAQAGQQRALRDHTYLRRVGLLLKTIGL